MLEHSVNFQSEFFYESKVDSWEWLYKYQSGESCLTELMNTENNNSFITYNTNRTLLYLTKGHTVRATND